MFDGRRMIRSKWIPAVEAVDIDVFSPKAVQWDQTFIRLSLNIYLIVEGYISSSLWTPLQCVVAWTAGWRFLKWSAETDDIIGTVGLSFSQSHAPVDSFMLLSGSDQVVCLCAHNVDILHVFSTVWGLVGWFTGTPAAARSKTLVYECVRQAIIHSCALIGALWKEGVSHLTFFFLLCPDCKECGPPTSQANHKKRRD